MNGQLPGKVWFCTSVGGGIFGASQSAAWRAMGFDARLHHEVELADYWRFKSGLLASLRLRWAMYVGYPRRLRGAVLAARKEELFVATTNPFFLPALAARAARRSGAKVVNLVYDLYPDALVFGGGMSSGHPVARLAAAATRSAIAGCDATVYLGERLRRHAEERYGSAPRTAVIPVGTDVSPFKEFSPEPRERAAIRCLYSGHMGRLHDWRTLAGAVAGGVPVGIEIELASDGPASRELCRALMPVAGRDPMRLTMSGTLGDGEWRKAMTLADVALVTMRPGAGKVVMPSKTFSAMAAGQAVLAVCQRESDLADLVARHDCGWIVEPGDTAGLRALLAALPRMRPEILRKRQNSWKAAHAHYSMEAVGVLWRDLFESLHER